MTKTIDRPYGGLSNLGLASMSGKGHRVGHPIEGEPTL